MTNRPRAQSELVQIRAVVTDAFHRNRRAAAATLAAVAVVFAVTALRGGTGPTVRVWVAAHDLHGGAPLSASDVALESLPRSALPAGAITKSPVGVMLGAPVRRGEPLTDVRLLSPSLLAAGGSPRDLAVPVRVTDGPAALALVTAGELVAVIAAGDPGTGANAPAHTVVTAVRVLAVPDHPSDDGVGLIVVAASPAEATALAEIPTGDRISIAVRR